MKKITGKVNAYLSEFRGPDDLNQEDSNHVVSVVTYSDYDMTKMGYTRIGNADIALTLIGDDEIVLNKIDALEKSLTSVLAKAEQEANVIRDRIQSLKAITCQG